MRRWTGLLLTVALLCALCVARADDTGALSETELNEWLVRAMSDSLGQTPLNAPVDKASLTEDGYAFLYSFATLYYDKPELDTQSRLQGISVTGEGYAGPRGVALGSDVQDVLDAYGGQNPQLLSDGGLAALYAINDLPRAAYWGWAQLDAQGAVAAVRLAMHVRSDEDCYTDAGLLYELEDGKVTGIRAYGLCAVVTLEEVVGNLNAVLGVEAASGLAQTEPVVVGYYSEHDANGFLDTDLVFDGLNFLTATDADARALLGEPTAQNTVTDDTGEALMTLEWTGVSMTFAENGARLETVTLTGGALEGPRGLAVGMPRAEALKLFMADGEGRVLSGSAVLYGDGINAPYGLLEGGADAGAARYVCRVDGVDVTLRLAFAQGVLSEIMIYSW